MGNEAILELEKTLQGVGSLWDGLLNPVTVMENAISGKMNLSFSDILLALLGELFKNLTGNMDTVVYIIGITYLSVLIFAISAPDKSSWSETVLIVTAAILAVPAVTDFVRIVGLANDTMSAMSSISLTSIPLLAAVSLNSQSAVFLVIIQVTSLVIKNILLPLAVMYGAMGLCEVISDKFSVTGIRAMMRSAFNWILGITMVVFTFTATISGVVSKSFTSISTRSIKYAGAMVPVVGRYLSESADLVFSGAGILKDAAGVGVMIAIIVICLAPFIKMLAIVILYRLAYVFVSPVAHDRIKKVINAIADALSMIMSITALLGVMYIVNIAVLVSIGEVIMKEWLFGVITTSLILTLLLQLVPDGNIKNTVSIGFGFVFLLVIVSPLTGMISSLISNVANNKIYANIAYNDLLGDLNNKWDNNEYTENVLDRYVERLQNEVNKAVEINGNKCSSVVSVNRDIASDSFGHVLSVQCNVSKDNDTVIEEKKGIVKPIDRIEKIVIGSKGIGVSKPGDDDKDMTEEMKQMEASIKKAVSFILDIDKEYILVDWR